MDCDSKDCLELTPWQRLCGAGRNALVLRVEGVDVSELEKQLRLVVDRHDAFGLRFERDGSGECVQVFDEPELHWSCRSRSSQLPRTIAREGLGLELPAGGLYVQWTRDDAKAQAGWLVLSTRAAVADRASLRMICEELAQNLSGADVEESLQWPDVADWIVGQVEDGSGAVDALHSVPKGGQGQLAPNPSAKVCSRTLSRPAGWGDEEIELRWLALARLLMPREGLDESVDGLVRIGQRSEGASDVIGSLGGPNELSNPTEDRSVRGGAADLRNRCVPSDDDLLTMGTPNVWRAVYETQQLGAAWDCGGGKITLCALETDVPHQAEVLMRLSIAPDAIDLNVWASAQRRGVVEAWAQSIAEKWERVCEDVDAPVSVSARSDRTGLDELVDHHDRVGEQSPPRTFVSMFEENLVRDAEAQAVVTAERSVSYRWLDERSRHLAADLQRRGVKRGDVVGLLAPRGVELIVGLVGIVRAGAAYVGLDPRFPSIRCAEYLQDAGAQFVVCQSTEPTTELGVQRIDIPSEATSEAPDVDLVELEADDLAYVLYTSGSTGRPKGVEVTHGAITNYLQSVTKELSLSRFDKWGTLANPATDLGHTATFGALAHGCTLCVPEDADVLDGARFSRWLRRTEVEVLKVVPSHLEALMEEPDALGSLKCVLLGGEALRASVTRKIWQASPDCKIFNHYGPTEASVGALTSHVQRGAANDEIPIGRALPGYAARIEKPNGELAAPGQEGELLLGGPSLARGYRDRARLTAERFVQRTVRGETRRFYRTGDRVRAGSDLAIHFVGRVDDQVKVRGVRVELGEVRARLEGLPGVEEAFVVPKEGELHAYVAPLTAEPVELRRTLAAQLPDAMVPAQIVGVPSLPRSSNGKVDRSRLPAPSKGGASRRQDGSLEGRVSEVWEQVLGCEVGLDDDFFDLGGHSLKATQLVSRLRRDLGLTLDVADVFDAPTVRGLVARISATTVQTTVGASTIRRANATSGPVSSTQRRLWVLDRMEGASAAYNVHGAFDLRGDLDVEALVGSVGDVVLRHEVLRSSLDLEGDEVVQRVLSPSVPEVPLQTISAQQVDDFASQWCARAFDLESGQPLRLRLLQVEERHHVLLLCMHHVVSDAWSASIFIEELCHHYRARVRGELPTLCDPPIQYLDYARWQKDWLVGDEAAKQRAYWSDRLKGVPPVLAFPSDRSRPSDARFRGARIPIRVGREQTSSLERIARQESMSLFMVILSAYAIVLAHDSGQQDFCIGTPIANRRRPELENSIGCFINSLALRMHVDPAMCARELRAAVRETVLAAQNNQDLPFDEVVEAVAGARDASASPIYQVMLILQNAPRVRPSLEGVDVSARQTDVGVSKQDLTVELTQLDGELVGHLEFDTDLFDAERIEGFVQRFYRALDLQQDELSIPVGSESLLSQLDHEQFRTWNDTFRDFSERPLLVDRVWRNVAVHSEEKAVVDAHGQTSYADLGARIEAWMKALSQHGVGRGDFVGVCLERSLDIVAAPMAIWSVGATYVPLDATAPRSRLSFIDTDASLAAVCVDAVNSGRTACFRCEQVMLSSSSETVPSPPRVECEPSEVAYLFYTSGTSGQPKGVLIEHGNLRNFIEGMEQRLGDEPTCWLAMASVSFDISLLELFYPLCHGGKLVVARDPLGPASAARASRHRGALDLSLFYFGGTSEADGEDSYRLLREGAQFADRNGLSAVWTPERHFGSFGGLYPNPSVTGAAIAAWTERVEVRAGSCVLPLQSPLRVAEEWAVVDNISKGRVSLSFASGWHAHDFVLAPDAFEDRKQHMFEGIEQVRKAWRGEALEYKAGNGERVSVQTFPRPMQTELPVWVTAAGNPKTFEKAGEIGAFMLTHLLGQSVEQLSANIQLYREAWERAGYEPSRARVAVMVHTFLGDDEGVAMDAARGPFREYLRDSVDLVRPVSGDRGIDPRTYAAEDLEALLDHASNRYMNSSGLFGTVERVMPLVDSLKSAGVDEIACLIDFGVEYEAVIDALPQISLLRESANRYRGPEPSLVELMREHNVTHLQCTPTVARLMLDIHEGIEKEIGRLEVMLVGGEALDRELATRLQNTGLSRLLNVYGPTEATIWASVDEVDDGRITLGRPLANTKLRVVDPSGRELPAGIDGELVIEGALVGAGYLKRPELSNERFSTNAEGTRGYRTGDRVRRLFDGRFEFKGRLDRQVKIRGHRVELQEIERVLVSLEGVREVAVDVREVGGRQVLVAFVTGLEDEARFREAVGQRLPTHMQPQRYLCLAALPLSAAAKIDRGALRALEVGADPKGPVAHERAAANEVEEKLIAIWESLLGRESIGLDENFFSLGGDSIISIQMVGRANDVGIGIAPRDVFQRQTVRELAAVARVSEAVESVQAALTGEAPLLPMQGWFLRQERPRAGHYVQSVLLKREASISHDVIREAWDSVLAHHDALRLRVVAAEGGWRQYFDDANASLDVVDVVDVAGLRSDEAEKFMHAVATDKARAFDLESGPTTACVVFEGFADGSIRLWLAAHHLFVDGVSWRILAEDLERAVRQLEGSEPIAFPRKTASVRQWSEALKKWGEGLDEEERRRWERALVEPTASLPLDAPGDNLEGQAKAAEYSLDRVETSELLRRGERNGGMEAALVTALASSLGAWARESNIKIDLEGHGRTLDEVNSSRTVGWLTAMYPVVVKIGDQTDLAQLHGHVRDTLRDVPRGGIGAGVLCELVDEELSERSVPAQVQLNYLGQADASAGQGPLRFLSGSMGTPRDAAQKRSHLLNVVAIVRDGELHVTVFYGEAVHQRETVDRVGNAMIDVLRSIARDRTQQYRLADLDQGELADLFAELEIDEPESHRHV